MEPTEQFPVPPPEPSFWRRYRAALLAAAVVVVLAGGVLVWALVASPDPSAAPPPAPTTSSTPPDKHHPAVRGTVTAENGDTWTVRTDAGDTVSVAISDKTKFGDTDRAKIVVNSKVVVVGKNADGKVDARRIRLQAAP